jgi:hypothetical protein
MAESDYQRKLKKEAERNGWTVIKLVRATVNGYPDLICLHPIRGVLFIEVKDAKGKLSKLQEYRISELRGKGFNVIVSDPDDYHTTAQIMADISRLIDTQK